MRQKNPRNIDLVALLPVDGPAVIPVDGLAHLPNQIHQSTQGTRKTLFWDSRKHKLWTKKIN